LTDAVCNMLLAFNSKQNQSTPINHN